MWKKKFTVMGKNYPSFLSMNCSCVIRDTELAIIININKKKLFIEVNAGRMHNTDMVGPHSY